MRESARATDTIVGGQTGFAIPLIVAVTGHRDLVNAEQPAIRSRVRELLAQLVADYPERGITVMSPLAEGADQLVAEEALSMGLAVVAPLPMPRELYVKDFESTAAREKFDSLLARATEVFELPVTAGNTAQTIENHGKNRTRQYAQLGVFLCAHCHILLALWDGKYSDKLGGTGQVVRFHHDNIMPGYVPHSTTSRMILADDESDLVYHIACSRECPGGQPADGLDPQSCSWFTTDEETPRTAEIPRRNRKVFELTSEFSKDACKYESNIQKEAWSLIDGNQGGMLPLGARDIDHIFRAADWLAIFFQRRFLMVLQGTHILALLMGLMYIIYSDLLPNRVFIFSFVLFFIIAVLIRRISGKRSWQRKYLDYRALAEGLRVQFYWAVGGVTSGNVATFSHDNFLQSQDADLGWIRNAMRVAGMECDANPSTEKAGLDFTLREWIGDESSGQLGYYRKKAIEKIRRNKDTEKLASIVLWTSIVAFLLFSLTSDESADRIRDPVIVLMGVLLLLVGLRQSYGFSIADLELIKQFRFMCGTFSKAHKRVQQSDSDEECRRVLRLLGEVALEEHAAWLLMHRERSLDEGEIWRMTG